MSSVPISSLPPGLSALLGALSEMASWITTHPPEAATVGRFGNKAFRAWHGHLTSSSTALMARVVDAASSAADAAELAAYLDTSFGNEVRIDYGSGHEAHFCLLVHILGKLGVFTENDDAAVGLIVFPAYLRVVRALQKTYNLEPAGSHGVWGLDDFSFLPFLWGSSQLLSSTRVLPDVIDDDARLEELRGEYLYLDAIKMIKDVKKAPFAEHSPILYDVSRVKAGWPKINQGMIKMYKGEVWLKVVVVQLLLFGDLFPFCPEKATA